MDLAASDGTQSDESAGRHTAMEDSRLGPDWACPDHRTPLTPDGEVLHCEHGHTFAVRDGIPRFVESGSYAAAFGPQWIKYRRTQLDSFTGVPLSRERGERCLGPEWPRLEGLNVLECGCGAGRFTEVLLAAGARVTSIDLTEAVEANQLNFRQDESHRIAQADILNLPFRERCFDVVFCLGVIQHTPCPEQTISALYDHLRPGGVLAIDHYKYRLSYFLSPQPATRAVLKRLPPDVGMRATDRLVSALWPVHSRFRNQRKLINRFSPVFTYFDEFPDLDDEHQQAWSFLDTHDALTDHYKHFRTVRQVRHALEDLGAERVSVWKSGHGIEARAYRPAAGPGGV